MHIKEVEGYKEFIKFIKELKFYDIKVDEDDEMIVIKKETPDKHY